VQWIRELIGLHVFLFSLFPTKIFRPQDKILSFISKVFQEREDTLFMDRWSWDVRESIAFEIFGC
jgi:hypothetical protein